MSALSAFRLLAKFDDTDVANDDPFFGTEGLNFTVKPENDLTPAQLPFVVPANLMREIQIQFITDASGQLEVTYDNTNYVSVNNVTTINGLATFTIFVDDDTILNFRFDNGTTLATPNILMWVGG